MSLKEPEMREQYLADVDWTEAIPYFSNSLAIDSKTDSKAETMIWYLVVRHGQNQNDLSVK